MFVSGFSQEEESSSAGGGSKSGSKSKVAVRKALAAARREVRLVNNVVNGGTGSCSWGTDILLFSTGAGYRTTNGDYWRSGLLQSSGNSYKASTCNYKVLMRHQI